MPASEQSGDDPGAISRAGLRARATSRLGVAVGGIVAAGAGTAAGLASATGRSRFSRLALTARDRDVLQLALSIEDLQARFYATALRRGRLTGEARQLAEVVGREERAHQRYLQRDLGASGAARSRAGFVRATSSNQAFVATAVQLEDLGVAAYNGQAENLTADALRAIARVISVEGRHAAWARGLAGMLPAPEPIDRAIDASEALAALRPYLDQ